MIRVMFDSTNISDIPPYVDSPYTLIATYCNGIGYVSLKDVAARFPKSRLPRINVTGDPSQGGDVLDVENGDATVADIDPWVTARQTAGAGNLAVYCNRSNLSAVLASRTRFYVWVATLDGTLHIAGYTPLQGPAAIQFAPAPAIGLNVDASLVFNDNWHPVLVA